MTERFRSEVVVRKVEVRSGTPQRFPSRVSRFPDENGSYFGVVRRSGRRAVPIRAVIHCGTEGKRLRQAASGSTGSTSERILSGQPAEPKASAVPLVVLGSLTLAFTLHVPPNWPYCHAAVGAGRIAAELVVDDEWGQA